MTQFKLPAAPTEGIADHAAARPQKLFARSRVLKPLIFAALLHFLQKLFRSQATAPAAWQAVVLTSGQARRHARWVEQHMFLNWLEPYYKAYHLHKGGAAGRRGFQVQPLHEAGRDGALFFYDVSIGPGNFRHFYEHLGERMLNLGYHRACADQCTQRKEHLAETTLKQLFKPNPTDCPTTGDCNQRFGLVTIDLVAVNGESLFVRVATNAVRQPGFTPAASFEELLRELLVAPPPTPETQALIPEYYQRF